MPDYGARMADRKIKTIDRRLRFTYRTAERELKEKLADFNKKFAEKDRKKQKQLANGEITKDEYKAWLNGQVFIRSQWESKIRECQQVMLTHNKQAMNIVRNNSIDVFAENYNYQAFIAEQTTGISFGIYNTEAVARLIEDNPDILPEWKIDEEKDYTWNEKKVNNCVRQGIIQGESINQITDRLCKNLATMNENRMRMFARTAVTGAQNAGRQQQMEDAADLGIKQNKRWLATLDNRTRDAHRHLDGQEVPYNEPFESDFGKIEYPGDPSANPANVYNCRCTMVTIYPKYEDYSKRNPRRAYGEYENENGETKRFSYLTTDPEAYQKWKKEKEKDQYDNYMTNYDPSNKDKTVVTEEAKAIIDSALDAVFQKVEKLKDYFETVEFSDKTNIADTSPDGKKIRLNPTVFSTKEEMMNALNEAKKIGHTVGTDDPRFIIAHEIGHSIQSCYIRKKLHLENAVIGELQKAKIKSEESKLWQNFFLNMGFEDETKEQIHAIIAKEIGWRANESPSEMAAQAFAHYMYGNTEAPHAHKLAEYLMSLLR